MIREYDGQTPVIDSTALVVETAVLIGDVTIGARSSIWYGAVLRGDDQPIIVGCESNIQDQATLHDRVTVGDRVSVGHAAILHGCTVEDDCLIGMGAIILDGAVIGRGSIIAAGSLVLADTRVEPGVLFAGRPAEFKKLISPERSENLRRNIQHYLDQIAQYRLSDDHEQE